jgi:hypothetical protein
MISFSISQSDTYSTPALWTSIVPHSGLLLEAIAMRPAVRLLASPTTTPISLKPGTKPAPFALLPPIPLYRRLLRIHRKKLEPEARLFGDAYVKAEFRRHRDVENPLHIVAFLTEWQQYGQQLEGDSWRGEKLDAGFLDKLSDHQIGQMYELMEAIQKRGRESADEEIEGRVPPAQNKE